MKACVQLVFRSTVAAPLAIGVVFTMSTPEAMAKTSMLYCGSSESCSPYPYKPHGGHGAICGKHSPCYLSPDCKGEQVCEVPEIPTSQLGEPSYSLGKEVAGVGKTPEVRVREATTSSLPDIEREQNNRSKVGRARR